jgi:deazaflavin-dependent oxidoreductase (nitroreductase family)
MLPSELELSPRELIDLGGTPMADVKDWNRSIIEEFRANAGKVGGPFEGRTMLLLHSTGAKSGLERTNPLAYRREGEAYFVFASKGGAPTDPDWYRNLIASPDVTIEVGTDTIPVHARVTTGEERDAIWARQIADIPAFGEYEGKSGRIIPVVALEPR